jgi:hypothetical protein
MKIRVLILVGLLCLSGIFAYAQSANSAYNDGFLTGSTAYSSEPSYVPEYYADAGFASEWKAGYFAGYRHKQQTEEYNRQEEQRQRDQLKPGEFRTGPDSTFQIEGIPLGDDPYIKGTYRQRF